MATVDVKGLWSSSRATGDYFKRLQVWCSCHLPVRRDSHLAQDFWPVAERSFSLFWCTGGTALQVTWHHGTAVPDDMPRGSTTVGCISG